MTLTVIEAAATYERAMRTVAPAGPGVCSVCHTFIDPDAAWATCYACGHQPNTLDAVVPITYSEHLGQIHTVLRNYKDGFSQTQSFTMPRVASILWLFLEEHERCVASAAGARSVLFDVVTTVPSSDPEKDGRRRNLRWVVGEGCQPTAERFDRILRATGEAPEGRAYWPTRYAATKPVDGKDVLLIDDTWTAGGHAQSAGAALRAAGARTIGLVVIGRHIHRGWAPAPGVTNGDKLDAIKGFDWHTCCVHVD